MQDILQSLVPCEGFYSKRIAAGEYLKQQQWGEEQTGGPPEKNLFVNTTDISAASQPFARI